MTVEEFVDRENKIAALNEHCDGAVCSDCPCYIDSLKKYCVDGHTCDFDEMSDEGLDAYLKVIEAAKLEKMSSHDFAVAIAERVAQRELNAEKDNVNHPKHYELPNGLECIDVLLATQGKDSVMGFCLCNAMKYLYRHKRKNGIEDIKKARWYIDKYLELEAHGDD